MTLMTLAIVIPAFNEEKRLLRTFHLLEKAVEEGVFQGVRFEELILVDDGSQDQTVAAIQHYQKSGAALSNQVKLIEVKSNQGKGNAVHEGLKQATSELCLFADADTATPWNQFLKLNAAQVQVAFGSRDLPDSEVQIKQSWIRENMGRTFNLLVRTITGLPFRDTQCGFKLIHRPAILPFLSLLRVKRFSWDVEFLMFARAHQLSMKEVPVVWEHQDASRVHPIKDSIEMLLRVIQMRVRLYFLKIK